MKKLFNQYRSSLNYKITFSTILIVIIGIVSIILYTQISVKRLSDQTLDKMSVELDALIVDFYSEHITEVASNLQAEYDKYFDELSIFGHIVQNYFDNYEAMSPGIETLLEAPIFRDRLINNGNWLQNQDDEQTTVFLGRYLLDENGNIPLSVSELIKKTSFFDLYMPSFASNGAEKLQIYFTGGEQLDFTRMAPWINIGEGIYDVYPELYDLPMWQTFNPGLIDDWTDFKNRVGIGDERLIRTGKPVQDGITGEVNIGMTYPIFSPDDGKFLGELAYDIPLSYFIDYTESLRLGKNGFAVLMQSNGNVFAINNLGKQVLGFEENGDGLKINEEGFNTLERNINDSIYEDVRQIDFESFKELKEVSINGTSYFIISTHTNEYTTWQPNDGFSEDYWTMALVLPKDEVYSLYLNFEDQVNQISNIALKDQLYIAIIITFFVLAFIMLYNSKLTRKLNLLTHSVKELRYNQFSEPMEIDSNDEIGKLSTAFNEMQAEIHQTIEKLNVQNERLKDEIAERIKKDRMIDYLENFDAHTDLLNKKALFNILKEMKDSPTLSLITIGIDELRKINDAYTYKVGDDIIIESVSRLGEIVEDKDLLFRTGGDEFSIILKDITGEALIRKCDEIILAFKKPYVTVMHEISVSCSVGVSIYPNDTQDPLDLFKFSNVALNHAKEGNRGGYSFYSSQMNEKVRNRMETINELNHAIERNEFSLHYQPIIDLKTGKVVALEALIRWQSEKLGNIPPTIFIALAEETKQIIKIGDWVLSNAMQHLKILERDGHDKLNMAINISVVQFYQPGFVDRVKQLIEQYDIHPKYLTFEVTEGVFLNDLNKAQFVIEELKNLGIQIAVDDFGTGYSSLAYLRNLKVNHLKIDRTFIAESLDQTSQEIINAILALASSLKLTVVAEGIETYEQKEYLIEKGCQYGQGYLFSKPQPFDQLMDWLEDEK